LSPVILELEPPVLVKLRGDLTRVSVVAAAAGVVLLAFAMAWSRSARRLQALEDRAIREQRLVVLGSMSSVMAHELRNPIASLKGHAQLLLEDADDAGAAGAANANANGGERRRAKIVRVVAEAERLEALTTSLLDFVRDGPLDQSPVETTDLIVQALRDLPRERIAVDLDAAPKTILVDAARIGRALHNLVDNALKADGASGEQVELKIAREPDGEVIVEVRDRGRGIPPGTEAQIFEPFVTTRVRGTGLGLAIARRIAEQHAGTLTGEDHPTGGAVFRLRLPQQAPPEDERRTT
jgi:two-component system, NtrC family, sensor histidine kinase HydH